MFMSAGAGKDNGAKVIHLNPKATKELPGIRKAMPPNPGTRKLAQPPFIVPIKKPGEECAFRKSCGRACMEPARGEFTREAAQELRKDADYLLECLNEPVLGSNEEFSQRKERANRLTLILEGSAIPANGAQTENCACGNPLQGEKQLKSARAFTNGQMREVVEGMELRINLAEAYVSSIGGPVSGLHPSFAVLLSRIANLRVGEDDYAMNALMMDGGIHGIRAMMRMAGEPITPHEARMEYVYGLGDLLYCASVTDSGTEIANDYIARAISRFSPHEEITKFVENNPISTVETRKNLPSIPRRINYLNLSGMLSLVIEETFQAIVNMSSRLDDISSSSDEAVERSRGIAKSIYEALTEAIGMLAGKEMPNKKLLAEFCANKERELRGASPDPGEQAAAKHILRGMLAEGSVDAESAECLLGALSAEEMEWGECFARLGLENN